MTRCFIAFLLPKEVKKEILRIQKELRKIHNEKYLKLPKEGNLHLALKFLGQLNDQQIEEAEKIIEKNRVIFEPIDFSLEKFSAFPNLLHPKVLTIDLKDKNKQGYILYKLLINEFTKKGFILEEKLYRPHITLARAKKNLKSIVDAEIKVKNIEFKAEKLVLFKSVLTENGPIYTPLKTFILGTNVKKIKISKLVKK